LARRRGIVGSVAAWLVDTAVQTADNRQGGKIMITGLLRVLIRCGLLVLLVPGCALAAETIKFALIEPLSGPFANVGNNVLRSFQAEFDRINARGGVLGRNFELVAFDNKSNPQETTLQVQAAVDQDIRFILQAAGSNN
jgi:branched-chain amino acid transport system substrate-binding protein